MNQIQNYEFNNPLNLSKILIGLLYIGIGMIALVVIDSAISYNFYSNVQNMSEEQFHENNERINLIGLPKALFDIATIVTFLIWINRANKNARALGAKNMQFSPGWCVGWWFIPFAQLWKPYQAVREIWKTSKNIDRWQSQKNNTISLWWTLWIILGTINYIIVQWQISVYPYTFDKEGILKWNFSYDKFIHYKNIELAFIFSSIFDIALSIIFIKIIREICNRQLNQFHNQS